MTRYTLSHLETAACLWEAVLELRDRPETTPDASSLALALRTCVDTLGTAALRLIVAGWVDACPVGLPTRSTGQMLAVRSFAQLRRFGTSDRRRFHRPDMTHPPNPQSGSAMRTIWR